MTGAAICAKLAFMSILGGMAGITICWRIFEDVIDMALIALDAGMFAFQLEAERLVRKRIAPQVGQRSGRTAMIRMAGAAFERGALLRDRAVQFGHIEHLRGDVGMAGRTTIRHPGRYPWRSVACGTFGDLSVGSHAAERSPRLGIQASRCEHLTAADKCHYNNCSRNDQRGQNPSSRKTSKFSIFHGGFLFE